MPEHAGYPQTPTKKQLTRDERLKILTLRGIPGFSYAKIRNEMAKTVPDISFDQIRHTCYAGHPTPTKRSGRACLFDDQEIQRIKAWIQGSVERRQMSSNQIINQLGLQCHPETLRKALKRPGLGQNSAVEKPPLDLGTRHG